MSGRKGGGGCTASCNYAREFSTARETSAPAARRLEMFLYIGSSYGAIMARFDRDVEDGYCGGCYDALVLCYSVGH